MPALLPYSVTIKTSPPKHTFLKFGAYRTWSKFIVLGFLPGNFLVGKKDSYCSHLSEINIFPCLMMIF